MSVSPAGPSPSFDRYGPWLPAIIGLLIFIPSLPNELVYDDVLQVRENLRIRDFGDQREIWLTDWMKPYTPEMVRATPNRDLIYRPLMNFTLALNYAIHGMWPPGFRAINLLLHAGVCWLVWQFVWRLLRRRPLAWAAALLFAVHPVHVEAVIYIVGRAELMSAAFVLGGVLVLIGRDRPPSLRRTLAATPLFLLGLLSKESAVCYWPVAGLTLLWLYGGAVGRRGGWWIARAVALLAPLAAYLPLRYVALGGQLARARHGDMLNPLVSAEGLERVWGALAVLGHYVRLHLWPTHLSVDYGRAVIDPAAGLTPLGIVGALAAGGASAALVLAWRGGRVGRGAALLAGLGLAAYFLVSNTFILIATSVAERLMYFPSVVALTVLAWAWLGAAERLERPPTAETDGAIRAGGRVRVIAVGVLLAAVLLLASRSIVRTTNWATARDLFTHDADQTPASAQLNGLAALECLRSAMNSDDPIKRLRWLERGEAYARRGVAIDPRPWNFRAQLAQLLVMQQKPAAALPHLQYAAAQQPDDASLRFALGQTLVQTGDYAGAIEHLSFAMQHMPSDRDIVGALGRAQLGAGRIERGLATLTEAAQGDPRAVVRAAGAVDPRVALRYADAYGRNNPHDVRGLLALADALVLNRQRGQALELMDGVLASMPPDAPLRAALEAQRRRMAEEDED